MMIAVMVGVIVITFFIADIVNQSKIDTITEGHGIEIDDINSRNENFTDNYLQGSILIDKARENTEAGNLHFVIAVFWYNNALLNASVRFNEEWINGTVNLTTQCIENCSDAMVKYLDSYDHFGFAPPYFETAKTFTDRYVNILRYYIDLADSGQKLSMLRYNMSKYLMYAAQNLSIDDIENASYHMHNYSLLEILYDDYLLEYNEKKDVVDGINIFSEDREAEYPE